MPLYEFKPSFTVDQTDLSLTSTGSGVHRNKDITVDLGILDRISGSISDNGSFLSNAYVQNINVDILNIDGTVKHQNFLTDYKSNLFTITEYDNINVFGQYTKDFGIKTTVSESSQTNTSEFYFYGNVPEFSGITVRDSTGTTSHTGSQSSKVAVNASGQTGFLTTTLTFNNDSLYTSFDEIEVYASTGSDAFINQVGLNPVFSNPLNNAPIQSFNIPEGILPPDTGVYLHLVPYSNVGQGEAWTLGPYTFKNHSVFSQKFITGVTSGDITGALGFTPSSAEGGGLRTITAGGNTLGAGETLAFTAGSNMKITESAGAVTIAVDGSAELPTATIPNLAASKITSSTFANARISESSVTQHQAALTLVSGQITGALGYTPLSTETDDQTLDEVLAQGNTSSRNITAGAITGSALTIDTDTLFVDSSNNRVGIGTSSPAYPFALENSGTGLIARIYNTNADGDGVLIRAGSTSSATRALQVASTNDTKILTVNSNGRVGIGTTSPGHELTVSGSGTVASFISSNSKSVINLSDDGADVNLISNSGTFHIGSTSTDLAKFMINLSTGKVGIGTSSPDYRLDIGGDTGSADNTIRMVQADGGTAIRIGAGGGANDVNLLRVDGNSSVNKGESDSANFGFSLRYKGSGSGVNNSLAFFADNTTGSQTEALTILNDGKVGVGATAPDESFHIKGSATTIKAKIESTGTNSFPTLRLTNDVRSYDLQIDGATDAFRIYDSTSTAERFRITSSGNVGIGVTSPASLLHLASTGPAVLTIEADTDNATETDNARIVLKQDGALVVGRMGYENNINDLEFINEFNAGLSLGTNNTKRLTINGTGYANFTSRVGIGIASPEQELHVYQGTAKLESTDGNDVSLQLGRSDNANLWNFNHAGNDLRIYNSGGSGYDVLFGVNSGGSSQSNKVGINTATPSHQLDVNGTFQCVGDATFDANVNAGGVITTGGNTAAEVMSWLHVGRMWTFNGLPSFSGDSGTTRQRSDGNVPGILNTGSVASKRAMAALIRNTYNDYGGFSGAGPDYSRAIGASVKVAFFTQGEDSSRVRLIVGSPSTLGTYADEDPLSSHGFGVEFRRGSGSTTEWRVFAHNGTSLSASTFTSTGITHSTDPRTVAVYSDGAGNITAYTAMYGSTSYTTATTTGGPTATAGGASTFTSIQVATNNSGYVSGALAKMVFMGARFYAE